jgi:hypothetical protein
MKLKKPLTDSWLAKCPIPTPQRSVYRVKDPHGSPKRGLQVIVS